MLIIRELLSGKKRFSELKRGVTGVSPKVLTSQLRDMEKKGLLIRTVYPEIPPKVEYKLTDLGYTLKDILNALQLWGEEYQKFLTQADLSKDEFYIPSVISQSVLNGKATVKVFETSDKWYGITYREDLKEIKKAIGEYIKNGLYEGI